MKKLFTQCILILAMVIGLYPQDLKAENGQMMFVAIMSTFDEIPQVTGDGVGLITFLLSEDRTSVSVHGAFTDLTGPVMGCHIHFGASDTTGPVVIDMSSMVNGNRIKGTIAIPSALIYAYAVAGLLYVNVHTAAHPAGEIRGQLTWMADIVLPVIASGQDEIPPVATNGLGLGTFRFSQNLTRMDYKLAPFGLSGPVMAAHIHKWDEMTNGPVIAPLNTGEFISGFIDDPALVEEILFEIFTGGAYVNVHTAAHPAGEIRGQIVSELPNNAEAVFSGDQENPPVNTNARAYGYASLNFPNLDSISYVVFYTDMVATAAHIHRGAVGVNGPVITPLTLFAPGIYIGRAPITPSNVTAFMKDELYFNIHSSAHPGGEIRGQFQNNLLKSYAFDVCGDQEVPVKNVNGYGASFVTINKSNTELVYGLLVDGLSGEVLAAHIHDGAYGSNGQVLLGLETPQPFSVNIIPITDDEADPIDMDHAYVNVHTMANPAGEIRGQVRRSLSCKINVGTLQSAIQDISLKSNLVHDQLHVTAVSDKHVTANLFISDISGKQLLKWESTDFNSGENTKPLNVQSLSPGFYLLNVLDEHNAIRTFKFVKQ
jgi:Cu/Zn superoxide dismutase